MAIQDNTILNKDYDNEALQAFPAKGGFEIVATTEYRQVDFDAQLLGITMSCTITMDDGLAVPYSKGAVIALRSDKVYIFDQTFIGAIA